MNDFSDCGLTVIRSRDRVETDRGYGDASHRNTSMRETGNKGAWQIPAMHVGSRTFRTDQPERDQRMRVRLPPLPIMIARNGGRWLASGFKPGQNYKRDARKSAVTIPITDADRVESPNFWRVHNVKKHNENRTIGGNGKAAKVR